MACFPDMSIYRPTFTLAGKMVGIVVVRTHRRSGTAIEGNQGER